MELPQNFDTLGPAALKVVGFQLWVHGRQFPDVQDKWDADWLNVTAHCGANGASVLISGAILMTTDIEHWAAQYQRLYQEGSGEALLDPSEPNLRI